MSASSSTRRSGLFDAMTGSLRTGRRRFEREPHDEDGSVVSVAPDINLSAARLHDLPRDPEAEPESAELTRSDGTLEFLEDSILQVVVDPDPVIDDTKNGFLSGVHVHFDGLAAPVLEGV